MVLQNACPLRKSAPWPPNISDEHVFYIAPATRNASLQILFKCPTSAILFGNATTPSRFAHFLTRCTIPCACHAKRALNVQKWSERGAFWCVLHILTSKCASRRALFRHLNFQKWSENGVFWCALCIWLRNVFRATTACTSSSLIWPAGSAPAALASLLFDPPEPQIIGKTQCFATSLPFHAPASSFFWLFLLSDLLSSALLSSTLLSAILLFSLTLPISAFHLSILSEVWLLNFLR